MTPNKSRPAAFLAAIVLAAAFSVFGAAGPASAQTCGPGQVPNPNDPYGCINTTTTTATPPGQLLPECVVSDPTPIVGQTVTILITNVPVGLTVVLLLDGQQVDSAVAGAGPQALGAAPAGGAKSARSAAAPKAPAQAVANVTFEFTMPALEAGNHTLRAVGNGFVCECNTLVLARAVEGTNTNRGGGSLARTGFTVLGLLVLAAVLLLVGRSMVESSRRRSSAA